MQNNNDSVDSIYIIEIPVNAEAWHAKTRGKKESFHVVQVGKASNGTTGLQTRMRKHNVAWCYASGERESYSTVHTRSKPSKPAHYTVGAIHMFPRIIGVLLVEDNKTLKNSTEIEEQRIREQVGVMLNPALMVSLLTVTFVSKKAKTVLEMGFKGNFSTTELRLVSTKELKGLREWFQSRWSDGNAVYISEFDQYSSQWTSTRKDDYTLRLSCCYSDEPPFSNATPTTLPVFKEANHAVSLVRRRPTAPSASCAVASSEAVATPSPPQRSSKQQSSKLQLTEEKSVPPAEARTTPKKSNRSAGTVSGKKNTIKQPAPTVTGARSVSAPARSSKPKSNETKTHSTPTARATTKGSKRTTGGKTNERSDGKQPTAVSNYESPSTRARAKSAPSNPKTIAPAKKSASTPSKPPLGRQLNSDSDRKQPSSSSKARSK